MEITVTHSEANVHIVLKGEIDERGAEALKQRFGEIKLSDNMNIVFDFGGVRHIGSAGLGKLLLIYKTVAAHGGSVRIERIPAPIYDLLQQLKLNTILTLVRL